MQQRVKNLMEASTYKCLNLVHMNHDRSSMIVIAGKHAPRRRKDSKFYTLVKLVMSTASVANDNDSVSSSSIENDIRNIANRDSVLNMESNENTITSYNFLNTNNYSKYRL